MNKIDVNKELDCTGLNCPLPVLKTKKILDNMVSGEILKTLLFDVVAESYFIYGQSAIVV